VRWGTYLPGYRRLANTALRLAALASARPDRVIHACRAATGSHTHIFTHARTHARTEPCTRAHAPRSWRAYSAMAVQMAALLMILWETIRILDDITASTSSIMVLLSKLYSHPAQPSPPQL
jgi:hypothetical protein